jgi:diaminohydroxyphosphoribosylaminopyrimidine deaminase/5-amino-6-(5-phosphoribosylamino)uracil reductase
METLDNWILKIRKNYSFTARLPPRNSFTNLYSEMDEIPGSELQWMRRCFELARRGIGSVSPNPPVGAVLVFNNKILGEGFHTRFGQPHAEVEAVRSVQDMDRRLIPESTLYVSLEPCCTTGKTPPCTDLILAEGIKSVRIAISDPNPAVAGKGIELLRSNGVHVETGILEEEACELIRPFQTNILYQRPYVILKWAQSKYGFIGKADDKIWLSDPSTSTWSHRQRSMVDAIMVGARTVMLDDPLLTTRNFPGKSPHRVVYDPNGKLNNNFRIFNADGRKIFYFSENENELIAGEHINKYILSKVENHVLTILRELFKKQIGILLVEGGAYLHQLFINENLWDEAWVISTIHALDQGIPAPNVKGKLIQKLSSASDTITGILNEERHGQSF